MHLEIALMVELDLYGKDVATLPGFWRANAKKQASCPPGGFFNSTCCKQMSAGSFGQLNTYFISYRPPGKPVSVWGRVQLLWSPPDSCLGGKTSESAVSTQPGADSSDAPDCVRLEWCSKGIAYFTCCFFLFS